MEMKFEEAVAAMRQGQKVRRVGKDWEYHCILTGDGYSILCAVIKGSEGPIESSFSTHDVFADWEIFTGWDE